MKVKVVRAKAPESRLTSFVFIISAGLQQLKLAARAGKLIPTEIPF